MQAYGWGILYDTYCWFWPKYDNFGRPVESLNRSEKLRFRDRFARITRTTTGGVGGSLSGRTIITDGELIYFPDQSEIRLIGKRDGVAYCYSLYRASKTYSYGYYSEHGYEEVSCVREGNQFKVTRDMVSLGNTYVSNVKLTKEALLAAHAQFGNRAKKTRQVEYSSPSLATYVPTTASDLDADAGVILSEYDWFNVTDSFMNNRTISCTQEAYARAAADLPSVTCNTLANILELVDGLRGILRGDLGKLARIGKTSSDAWLTYRYGVQTTLSDIEEYKSYFARIDALSTGLASQSVKSRSVFTDNGWTYRCSLTVGLTEILPDSLLEYFKAFGLELNSVTAWDMVPYSFIVDWFLPIGDLLEAYASRVEAAHLSIEEGWFSIESPGGKHYLRVPAYWCSSLPVSVFRETSKKTLCLRIADAIALMR